MAQLLHAMGVDLIPLCTTAVEASVCPLLHEGHFLRGELTKLWSTSICSVETCEIVVIKQGYRDQLQVLHKALGLNLFEPTPLTGMAQADAIEPAGWKLGFSALLQQQCPDGAGSSHRGRHSPAPCALEDVEYATVKAATCFAIQPRTADDGSNQCLDGSDGRRHSELPCSFLVLLSIRRSAPTGGGCSPLTTEVYYYLGPHFNREYIVPRECYDACLRREFCVGQTVYMEGPYSTDRTIGQCYSGTIQAVGSHGKDKPPYLTLLVRWDDGGDEEVSPWEILEAEVGTRLLDAGPTAVSGRSRRPAGQLPGALALHQPHQFDVQDDMAQYLLEIDNVIEVFQSRQIAQAQQPVQDALQYEGLLQWLHVLQGGEEVRHAQASPLQLAHAAGTALEVQLERQPSHVENNNPDKADIANNRKRKACLSPTGHSPREPLNNAAIHMPAPLSTFLSKKLRPSAARHHEQVSGDAGPSAPAPPSPPQQTPNGHNIRHTNRLPPSGRHHSDTRNDHDPPPAYDDNDGLQGSPDAAADVACLPFDVPQRRTAPAAAAAGGAPAAAAADADAGTRAYPLQSPHHGGALHETALVIYQPPPAPSATTPLSTAPLPQPESTAAAPPPQDDIGDAESHLVLYVGATEVASHPTIPVSAAGSVRRPAPAPTLNTPAAPADASEHLPLPSPTPAPSPAPAATWRIQRSAPEHGALELAGQHCWFIGSAPAKEGQQPPDLLAPDAGNVTHTIIYFLSDPPEALVARQVAPLSGLLPRLTLLRQRHHFPAVKGRRCFSLQHGDYLCIGNSAFLVQSSVAAPSLPLGAAGPPVRLIADPAPGNGLQAPPPKPKAPFRLRPSAHYPRPTLNPLASTRLHGPAPGPSYSGGLHPAPSSGLPYLSTLGPSVDDPTISGGSDADGGSGGDGDGAAAAAAVLLQLACDSWPGAGSSGRPARARRAVQRMGA